MICFDSHKSAVATILSRQSIDLLLLPHAYPVPTEDRGYFRKERMSRILQQIAPLYASMLGVPVVLANQCGPWVSLIPRTPFMKPRESRFPGLSTIVDSDGAIKARLGDEEGVIVADVTVDPARRRHPTPPHYGRYVYPGSRLRVVVRAPETMGWLRYALSSTRRKKAREGATAPQREGARV